MKNSTKTTRRTRATLSDAWNSLTSAADSLVDLGAASVVCAAQLTELTVVTGLVTVELTNEAVGATLEAVTADNIMDLFDDLFKDEPEFVEMNKKEIKEVR